MKTLFAILTLVTLATACDPEAAPFPSDTSFRDGEVIIPPTGPIGTGLVVKGGHDLPIEVLSQGYDLAPEQWKDAFDAQVVLEAYKVIEEDFLANERNFIACPGICEDLDASWDEGVYIANLAVQHGAVRNETDHTTGQVLWTTTAEVQADVGCGCI
jgi:hypothetical protein